MKRPFLFAFQINQFQRLEQEITKPVENDISKWKPPQALQTANSTATSRDSQLLLFYSDQCETHFNSLLNAIDAFFGCVNASQPPPNLCGSQQICHFERSQTCVHWRHAHKASDNSGHMQQSDECQQPVV